MKYKWMRRAVIEPVTIHNMYEHTPLDIYKYGEYPRFIRPIRDTSKTEWVKVYENGQIVLPGELPSNVKLTEQANAEPEKEL